MTATGTWLSSVEPSPSSPYWFAPQHQRLPAAVTAQVRSKPAEIATTPESGLAPPPPLELAEELADEELELAEEDEDPPPPPLDELPFVALVLAWPPSSKPSSLRAPHPAEHASTRSQARMGQA